jgi:hypothetical protein
LGDGHFGYFTKFILKKKTLGKRKKDIFSKELQEKARKLLHRCKEIRGNPDVAGDAKDAIKKYALSFTPNC